MKKHKPSSRLKQWLSMSLFFLPCQLIHLYIYLLIQTPAIHFTSLSSIQLATVKKNSLCDRVLCEMCASISHETRAAPPCADPLRRKLSYSNDDSPAKGLVTVKFAFLNA